MKIIVANWKMNQGFDEIDEWLDRFYEISAKNFEELQSFRLILCPPAIFLDYLDSELIEDGLKNLEEIAKKEGRNPQDFLPDEVSEYVMESRPIRLGAQNCHHKKNGAYTGELSAEMLHRIGCEYVILGHSERRIYNQESDELIAKKVEVAVEEGLIPILCVGENIEIRKAAQHINYVKNQIISSLPKLDKKIPALLVAYEPIWAIGSGETASVGQINEITNAIVRAFENGDLAEKVGNLYVLYGGSVNEENSQEILALERLDGLLVGKASLNAESFLKLCPGIKIQSNSERFN